MPLPSSEIVDGARTVQIERVGVGHGERCRDPWIDGTERMVQG